MPRRINLKELFPSDSQELIADKLNFNFNKLLELGIGDKGDKGDFGSLGPAGPIGIMGLLGIRGNAWYVDAAVDPNSLTFTDVLSGDFYLDSVNFAVWQYDGTSWQFIFDLTSIINNYLAQTPAPFIRGLGIGSPNDDRFILFNRRGNTSVDIGFDITLGASQVGNLSNNDILFLNNFNEETLAALSAGFDFGPYDDSVPPVAPQISTSSLFNSLLSIYVDHQNGTALTQGRSHIDMGSLYLDGADLKLTDIVDNLKIRFYRTGSSTHSWQSFFNSAEFNLDVPGEPTPTAGLSRKTNSIFTFKSAKWNPTTLNTKTLIYLGSRLGLDEKAGASETTKADGILFEESGIFGNIGTARRYSINGLDFPNNTGYVVNDVGGIKSSYFMIDAVGTDTVGIYLDSKTLQDGGNFVQLGTTSPREIDVETSIRVAPASSLDHSGIAVNGTTIYTVAGTPATSGNLSGINGFINRFNVDNPNNPISEFPSISFIRFDGQTSESSPTLGACGTIPYNGRIRPVGSGISDIQIAGKYAYVVNTQSIDNSNSGSLVDYQRTYFQVLELDKINETGLSRISRLGEGETAGSENPSTGSTDPQELDYAYRLRLKGNHAIVARNAIHNSTYPNLGGTNYEGGFGVVDIADPENPTIIANINSSKRSSSGLVAYDKNAILDFDINQDTAYALVFQQSNSGGNVNYEVNIQGYDLSGLSNFNPTLSLLGLGTGSISSNTGVSAITYSRLPKSGAIVATDRYVYAGYSNMLRVYTINNTGKSTVPNIGCTFVYSAISSVSLDLIGTTTAIVDMKAVGNSLYVLAHEDYTNYYVFKYDISSQLNTSTGLPAAPVKIYKTELSSPGSKFEILGKHIYVATRSTNSSEANLPGLIALDFDGIYTGGAHIESLRADDLVVTGEAQIGGNLKVRESVTIGENLMVTDELTVGSSAQFIEDVDVNDGLQASGNVRLFSQSRTNYGSMIVEAVHLLPPNLYGMWVNDLDFIASIGIPGGVLGTTNSAGASGNIVIGIPTSDSLFIASPFIHTALPCDRLIFLNIFDGGGPLGARALGARAELWVETAPGSNAYYQQFRAYGLSSAQGIIPANCRFGILGKSEDVGRNTISWNIYKLGV